MVLTGVELCQCHTEVHVQEEVPVLCFVVQQEIPVFAGHYRTLSSTIKHFA